MNTIAPVPNVISPQTSKPLLTFTHTLSPYGPLAWLIQGLNDIEKTRLIIKALEQFPPPNFRELIVGYDTILLQFSEPITKNLLLTHLQSLQEKKPPTEKPSTHKIPLRYDGPDLAEVAQGLQLSLKKLIELHSEVTYTVRFLGFSPGFAYLDGLPEKLHLPRRDSPRTRMEIGAVAIGASHAGIYTIPSPGGWHWLGNTKTPLFFPERNDTSAFVLNPGDQIQFTPVSP